MGKKIITIQLRSKSFFIWTHDTAPLLHGGASDTARLVHGDASRSYRYDHVCIGVLSYISSIFQILSELSQILSEPIENTSVTI